MLEIRNLKINTKEGKGLIQDATFLVSSKEIVLIQGPNGSGKSTILSAIMSHPKYKVMSGSVILDGADITNLQAYEKSIAGLYLAQQFVPQIEGVTLIQLLYKVKISVSDKAGDDKLDNKKEEDNRIEEIKNKTESISILQFHAEIKSLCDKFNINSEFLTRELNVGLSGGEKKQAMLITLLALKPKYILLDEPDSGVDSDGVEKLLEVIKYLQEENNSGFVIVTHSNLLQERLNPNSRYTIQNQCLVKI